MFSFEFFKFSKLLYWGKSQTQTMKQNYRKQAILRNQYVKQRSQSLYQLFNQMDPSKQSPIIGIQDLEDLNLANQITHEIKRVEKTYLSLVLNQTHYYRTNSPKNALLLVLMSIGCNFTKQLNSFSKEEKTTLNKMVGKGIEQIEKLGKFHCNLLNKFLNQFEQAEVREIARQVEKRNDVKIQEAKVGYKKNVNLSLRNGSGNAKNLYSIIESISGKQSSDTLICYYELVARSDSMLQNASNQGTLQKQTMKKSRKLKQKQNKEIKQEENDKEKEIQMKISQQYPKKAPKSPSKININKSPLVGPKIFAFILNFLVVIFAIAFIAYLLIELIGKEPQKEWIIVSEWKNLMRKVVFYLMLQLESLQLIDPL